MVNRNRGRIASTKWWRCRGKEAQRRGGRSAPPRRSAHRHALRVELVQFSALSAGCRWWPPRGSRSCPPGAPAPGRRRRRYRRTGSCPSRGSRHRIVIRTNFTNTVQEAHTIFLDDLLDGAKRDLLHAAFTDPDRLRPSKTRDALDRRGRREILRPRPAPARPRPRRRHRRPLRQPPGLLHVRRGRRPAAGGARPAAAGVAEPARPGAPRARGGAGLTTPARPCSTRRTPGSTPRSPTPTAGARTSAPAGSTTTRSSPACSPSTRRARVTRINLP